MDKYFRVDVLNCTPNPQKLIWRAMHQCYSENYVPDENCPEEEKAGDLAVKHLLAGNKGHFGCIENPSISFAVGWFPHSVMQQARTHRVGITFDVQSGRYTGNRILDVVSGTRDIEEVFYFRPAGKYHDRQGHKYEYTEEQRKDDIDLCETLCHHYAERINSGFAEEHARDMIPYAIRQHFCVSFNCRSLMHFLDLRHKADAQLEIRQLCDLIYPHFEQWVPAISRWYTEHRKGKARLSP